MIIGEIIMTDTNERDSIRELLNKVNTEQLHSDQEQAVLSDEEFNIFCDLVNPIDTDTDKE